MHTLNDLLPHLSKEQLKNVDMLNEQILSLLGNCKTYKDMSRLHRLYRRLNKVIKGVA